MKTYRSELRRLRRGVHVAWTLNFIVLFLTIEAVLIFVFLSSSSTNSEIISFLSVTIPVSIVVSALIVGIVSASSSKILLGAAGDVENVEQGQVYNVVSEIAVSAGISVPEVYIADTAIMNAYAVSDGKVNRIVITKGLIAALNREQLQGVVAHEIGHIVQGDSQDMTKIVALTSFVGMASGLATRMFRGNSGDNKSNPLAIVLIIGSFLFLIAAPLLSKIAQLYMSRTREEQADVMSVKLTHDPTALAQALARISNENVDDGKFMKKAGAIAFSADDAFRTHPPIEKRIEHLREMGAQV